MFHVSSNLFLVDFVSNLFYFLTDFFFCFYARLYQILLLGILNWIDERNSSRLQE